MFALNFMLFATLYKSCAIVISCVLVSSHGTPGAQLQQLCLLPLSHKNKQQYNNYYVFTLFTLYHENDNLKFEKFSLFIWKFSTKSRDSLLSQTQILHEDLNHRKIMVHLSSIETTVDTYTTFKTSYGFRYKESEKFSNPLYFPVYKMKDIPFNVKEQHPNHPFYMYIPVSLKEYPVVLALSLQLSDTREVTMSIVSLYITKKDDLSFKSFPCILIQNKRFYGELKSLLEKVVIKHIPTPSNRNKATLERNIDVRLFGGIGSLFKYAKNSEQLVVKFYRNKVRLTSDKYITSGAGKQSFWDVGKRKEDYSYVQVILLGVFLIICLSTLLVFIMVMSHLNKEEC
eukprot:GAHX01001637.1.p1 GENE.GAHX01001637.1~~GAHX01001637.1.p1  ORF type:complete len:343 (-),score=34.17 GAHX01001637.1:147-1175(-)